jgi:RNA polymerase sigma-70 factor (ECF subfamily)
MISDTPEVTGPAARGTGFASTHWSVVLEAARQDSALGQAALSTLYRTYWKPIQAFVRRNGFSPQEADDLTQDFFGRLVEKNWLSSITREGGRFRSLLLTAVKHFLAHARAHDRAAKRGGGRPVLSLEGEDWAKSELWEPADHITPERVFEQRWALRMLEEAMTRLRLEYVRAEKADLFDELQEFLSGGSRATPHAEIAARHDISVGAVGVAIYRLRRRYGEILRAQVARTVADPAEVNDELRHLITVLGPPA